MRCAYTTVITGILLAATLGLSGCSSSGTRSDSSRAASTSGAAGHSAASSAATAGAATGYYLSVGDSYAAGYQPTGRSTGSTTRNGFAYQVVPLAQARGTTLRLVNLGCSGATTASVLDTRGCPAKYLGPGSTAYTGTQAEAAVAFLRAHRGQVRLVTVSLGGNDVTACRFAKSPIQCVTTAITKITTNLSTLVTRLRAAAGTKTTIVGLTYPDVLLGLAVSPGAANKTLAQESVLAFQELINPALRKVYTAVGARFVDVTAATGAYGSQTAMTTLAPYGRIPTPVAKVCELTFFCQYQDIHPRTSGYALIARLIAATLPRS